MKSPDASFFTGNREAVYDALKGGLLVVTAYTQTQRSNDTAFRFEQEANFWYLTGIEHPDWKLLIDAKRRKSWLVAPHVEQHHELFDGSLSHEHASLISGIHDVIDERAADAWLRQASRSHTIVHMIDVPAHAEYFGFYLNPSIKETREMLDRLFTKVQDFRPDLAKLRAIKQPEEIAFMQSAIDLTIEQFQHVYKQFASYKYEYEIEADFSVGFRRSGAPGHAYDPIVAAGANACTLHYIRNDSKLSKGQMVLLDIGARRNGYAADITRTYAFGKVTKRQRQVHEAVEYAQSEIIDLIEPGLMLDEYQDLVDGIMQRTLKELKLISGPDDDKYRKYFPHAISHGLGIDVHDALGRPRMLQEGMVLTVEPGIYIPEEKIGIRIEDDILVTSSGHRNMSAKLSTAL
jgi:Xaa-Pro aminopeptidase